ncbi:MAG: hypothetical protein A2Y38_04915 [Spirochaetes bacterium GWB1_59_5]|nr:MAG: hypothetical protein A2Y38_04915 [Spirochaetes bacterium GWB1_59_5]
MKQVDDETREILESFIAEAYERLDDAETVLSKAGCEAEAECLGTVFRLFHSVKGSAAFLDLNSVRALTHEAETLLEVHIKGGITVTNDSLDVIFQTIDMLRTLVKAVQSEFSDEGHTEQVAAQIASVRSCIEVLRAGMLVPDAGNKPLTAQEAVPQTVIPQTASQEAQPYNEIILNELVTRDMTERFLAESSDLVDRLESDALGLLASPNSAEDVHAMFRAIHTIKGNAGFFGYELLEGLCMGAESHLDQARKGAVATNEAFINATLSHVDAIRRAVTTVRIFDEPPVRTAGSQPEPVATLLEPSPIGVSRASGASAGGLQQSGPQNKASDTATGINVYRPLGEILVDMGAADAAAIQSALEIQEKPLGELLVESGAASRENVTKALEKQRAMEAKPAEPVGEEVQRREIRVDTAKLDKLFDLVGELITAEAMVVNSPDLKGLKLDHFERSYSALNKISREIQETTMAIRMIPMDGLFHKMTRLVRDLSRKFGKPVDFRVSGQDTEMDKNVIEQISDPLVHILRNSIDHGLELPAERKASGKPEAGTVTLDARYEGSEIWVSIKDDGKGLNKEKILAKAAERGLLKVDPATLEDKDIWAFIFEPGFSTAQVVSEVSGRGVGMDVVRKNLDRIRGAVDVRSTAGKETEFVLRIPLTMAIIEGITVRVGPNYYSIPLNDILEFFKARPDQITRTADGGEMVSLRGEILPLAKLWQVFKIEGALEKPEDGILLVVNAGGRKAGLLIDEVLGNQQIVIKSLSEYLGKVDGVSGCSILGDGTVSFIIDTGRLLSLVLE